MSGKREHRHTRGIESALQLGREQQVGQLALAVGGPWLMAVAIHEVVEVETSAHAVGHRRDAHDARPRPGHESGQEQAGEGEVPEVVSAELQLESVSGRAMGGGHHARIINKEVQPARVRGRPDGGELTNTGEVGEVEPPQRHGSPGLLRNEPLSPRSLGVVTDGKRHICPVSGQFEGCSQPQARVGPGHDRRAAGEIGHVVGGPAKSIGHGRSQLGDCRMGQWASISRARRLACTLARLSAPLAQTAERLHGKEKVYGSIP